jgi:hypothetical protein
MNRHKKTLLMFYCQKLQKCFILNMPIIRNKGKQCQCFIVKNVKDETLSLKDMKIMSNKIQNVSISEKL